MKTTTTIIVMILIFASVGIVTSVFVHPGVAFATRGQHHQFTNDMYIPDVKHYSEEKLHIKEFQLFDDIIHVTGDK
ncbi:MAG: hypothetical protein ACTHJ7_05065 [Candidatus Nitrosocosmicus sp.]